MAINVDISKITGINQVGNSYQRKSAVPLDYYSLFNTKAEAEAYAKSNPVSYVGQVISYIDNNEVKVCVIADTAGTLKEVGTAPVGDNKTIEVSAAGAVALLGAATAANGTLPMIEEVEGESQLVWKTLEDIGAGDGNDNTTYTFNYDKETQKLTITPNFNGVAQQAQEIDLSDFLIASELPEDKNTTYNLTQNGMVLTLTPSEGGAQTVTVDAYSKSEVDTKLKALEDEDSDIRAIAENARDTINTFLNSEEVDETVNTLKEIQAEIEKMTDATELAEALANKADKSVVNGIETRVKAIEDAPYATESYADEAASEAQQAAIKDAASKYYGKTEVYTKGETDTLLNDKANSADVANTYATKEFVGTIPSEYTESNVIAYVNKKAEEVLSQATGGSSESAASVKAQLDTYKSENEPKFAKLENIEDGAQVNVIESVVVDNGDAETTQPHKLTATLSGKTITLNDSALQTAIAEAKKAGTDAAQVASQAVAAAGENANKIQTNTNDIGNLKTLTGEHSTKLANLEAADIEHNALYESLKETVDGHTSTIAGKANQSSLDAVSQKASTNEQAIKTLNETTIPAINQEVANKANSTDVAATYATKAEVGTPDTGKTIVQMIADAQAAATYDDTSIKALIKSNTDAIAAEKSRAEGVEADHEGRIAEMETFWAAADDPEGTIDKLAEIVAYIESDKTGALDMAADIKNNTDAITAINDPSTGILATSKDYTDSSITTLQNSIHGVDDETIKLKDNKAYVAGVSTDILTQGVNELIFCAGNASS